MKRLLLSGLVSLALSPLAGMAANYFNPNGGLVTSPIDIQAVNFTNYGTFNIYSLGPFETWDTLNYHNKGQMNCAPGWRFHTLSSANGSSRLAANFVNENPGVIRAVDSSALGLLNPRAVYNPSKLFIWATNITSGAGIPASGGAALIVGANGRMELAGTNINISRSGLEVLPVWAQPAGSLNNPVGGTTNFYPDVAVYDKYWAQTNFHKDYKLDSGALWNGFTANAQAVPGPPQGSSQPYGAPGFSLDFPLADSYTNVAPGAYLTVTVTNENQVTNQVILFTDVTKGAVFVRAPPNMNVQLGFTGPYENGFDTIGVLLSIQRSNAATTLSENAYIYVADTFASQPPGVQSRGILPNPVGNPANTFRPANYIVSRQNLFPGNSGNSGTNVPPDFFTSSGNKAAYPDIIGTDSVTNTVYEAGDYAGYSAFFDNTVTRSESVAGGGITNLPGRIRILADTLDMSKARLRAEGYLRIQARHLISSSNAVVDCENLSFDLGKTNNETLRIQNLGKNDSTRLRGQIYAWSAEWSNSVVVIITNNFSFSNYTVTLPDGTTGTETAVTRVPLTNTVNVNFHTLMLDATHLEGLFQVSVYDLTTRSTNVVIHDNLSVIQTLSLDARNLTLKGNMTLPGYSPSDPLTGGVSPIPAIQNWTYPVAPNLLYFTNHGALSIANEAHFGDDGLNPYSVLVNTGSISAASIQVNSTYVENRGSLSAGVGSLILQGGTGKLENGNSVSDGEMQFWFGSLKFDHYQALANNNAINFWITDSLSDAGPGSANVLEAQNGFNLYLKPPTGDLLGTTLQSTALNVPYAWIGHVWAGQDRGLGAAGYSTNVAVGRLVLATYGPNPLFYFSGTGVSNALYADYLDLSQLTDYANQIQIDPSLTIYYAAASLGFTPPLTNEVAQQPEEYLDGQFDGHLRWVRDFAGPNSSVDVVINGNQTIQVNRALRNSKIIDSNGDGIPNFYDLTPFDEPAFLLRGSLLQTNQPPGKAFLVSWTAVSNTVYQVEFTTNLPPANWQPLVKYTNNAPTNRTVTIWDTNGPAGFIQRFYRVGHGP